MIPNRNPSGGNPRGSTGAGASTSYGSKYIALLAHGQIAGCVYSDDRILRKVVRGSIHKLRSRPGWSLDMAALVEAQRLGAVRVEVVDQETGEVYRATMATVLAQGSLLPDWGFGPQWQLSLCRWTVTRPGTPQQLDLFAEGVTP